MSYCRWSSMTYQCDLYVYASEAGLTCHVAAKRTILNRDLPNPAPGASIEQTLEHDRALSALLASARIDPIGLPYDGQTFDGDPAQVIADIEMLIAAGYRAPDDLLTRLRKDYPQ